MQPQATPLRQACLSLWRRAQSTSSKQSPTPPRLNQKPPSNPFDNLGYQLVEQPATSEPHATQRSVIDALGPSSFTISGVRIKGSVLIMPFFSTLWNVESIHQIEPQSFALVKLIVPRPDIVVVGTGHELLPISLELRQFFKDINVNIDAMDTKNACHTFNVLNQEGRNVAAALVPVGYQQSQSVS